jgi:hypothetical protein
MHPRFSISFKPHECVQTLIYRHRRGRRARMLRAARRGRSRTRNSATNVYIRTAPGRSFSSTIRPEAFGLSNQVVSTSNPSSGSRWLPSSRFGQCALRVGAEIIAASAARPTSRPCVARGGARGGVFLRLCCRLRAAGTASHFFFQALSRRGRLTARGRDRYKQPAGQNKNADILSLP